MVIAADFDPAILLYLLCSHFTKSAGFHVAVTTGKRSAYSASEAAYMGYTTLFNVCVYVLWLEKNALF